MRSYLLQAVLLKRCDVLNPPSLETSQFHVQEQRIRIIKPGIHKYAYNSGQIKIPPLVRKGHGLPLFLGSTVSTDCSTVIVLNQPFIQPGDTVDISSRPGSHLSAVDSSRVVTESLRLHCRPVCNSKVICITAGKRELKLWQ